MLSPNELITFLTRHQFLSSSQGEALNRDRTRFVSSVQLCGELVQRGWLTPYQQAQLLSGNGEKLIIGAFRVQSPLGEGGMGMVFKAIQPKLDRVVALKVIRPQVLAARPEILSRFHREAKAIAQLNHPNVVILFDADEMNGTHYIAMEYVEGQTLEKMVRTQGPMSIRQAAEYMRQSAQGLQHAYEVGLVHRDIKPSNIVVAQKSSSATTSGGSSLRMARPTLVTVRDRDRATTNNSARMSQGWGQVKILDMGLARLVEGNDEDRPQQEQTPLTRAGALLGTPDFIAPEQARDARQVDIRADIYSLGCTFYYILTGKPPFPGGTDVQKLIRHQTEKPYPIEELRPGIPHEITTILMRMLEKRPEDRYATPRHLADALDIYVNPALPTTPVPSPVAETASVAESTAPRPARTPNINRDTVPVPTAQDMRDTMPVPVAPRPMAVDASGVTRPTGPGAVAITKPRTQVAAHNSLVTALTFSPDGRMLASVGIDGKVRLWDLTCHVPKEIGHFPRPGAEFQSVAFAPHDDFIIAGGTLQGTARIWRWDWKDGKVAEWGAYQGDNAGVPTVSFAPDGKKFAAGIGPFVILWKVNGRTAGTGEILKGHSGRVKALAWSPDSKRLVSAGEARSIRTWGFGWLGTSQKSKWHAHTDVVTTLSFAADGRHLATAGLDKKIVIWDADDPKEESALALVGHTHQLRLVQYLPDGNLLTIGQSGQVLVFDTTSAAVLSEFQVTERVATCVTASVKGDVLAMGSTDGKVAVFETVRPTVAATVG